VAREKVDDENPLFFREDVGPHVSSRNGSVVEGLNTLRFYNSNCRVGANGQKAKNLASEKETTRTQEWAAGATTQSQADTKGKIVEFLWYLKKEGYRESTITTWTHVLKALMKQGCNLLDPESVKETIANSKCSENTKVNIVTAYSAFARMLGLQWNKPNYKMTQKLPFIPTETEIDQLIAATGKKTSTFLQLLKETGMRSGEAIKLKWIDVDFEQNTVRVNNPEKNSNARMFKVSGKLIAMLNALPKKSESVFEATNLRSIRTCFMHQRKNIAKQLQNPRLLEVKFHTLRHWKATMEYHKTKDILHVMKLLGHKRIDNTLIYTQLVTFESDEYTCKVARNEKEVHELIEAGFEYVCDLDDAKFFRKRK
jgi:integrase